MTMINRRATDTPSTTRSRRRRRGSARSGGGRGGGRGKGPLLGGLAALAVLSVGALIVNGTTPAASSSDDGAADVAQPSTPAPAPERSESAEPSGGGTASADAGGEPGAVPDEEADRNSDADGEGVAPPDSSDIPATGPGTFATAGGGSGTVGKGSDVLRYKVVVEKGLTQSAADVARQVEGILADRRGWTADGRSGFRRVSSGTTDFVVRLATPGTVDAICGKYGLNTRGEVNCNVGKDVVVNLKRWLLATPVYADDVDAYRALIINHEVGHFLGHGHVTCPGAGKPAPAMMQQIKGMRGCKPNVWPYDTKGRFVTGPAVS
ncbi:DUF3152 domain-containing protein [Streptomyces sp. NPDC057298]|uniref:DUF3152 domain-containing protein n=1 Tax=Streptomyces sp. NPDC057298 TaxID=3346091 RepID=UPI00362AFFD2